MLQELQTILDDVFYICGSFNGLFMVLVFQLNKWFQ